MISTEKINVVDSISKITKEFTINKAKGENFRFVHDSKTAFTIIEGTDKNETSCIHIIEEFATNQECLDRIKELGLKYDAPEIEPEPIQTSDNIRLKV